ncbi:hypothetical protein D3C72_2247920 [compost metagenome]
MRGFSRLKNVGNQHGIVETLHDDAVALHQQVVIFEVLRDFQNGFVFKKILQTCQRLGKRHLSFSKPDSIAEKIATGAGLVRQWHIGSADIGA